MIASFRLALGLLCVPTLALGQTVPEVPDAPALPEMPALPEAEVPEVSVPEVPERPELPKLETKTLSRVPEGYRGKTQFVLDHRRRVGLYPRLGVMQMVGNDALEGVTHLSAGLDLQVALSPRFFLAGEGHLFLLTSGSYDLVYAEGAQTLTLYEEGQSTLYAAVGPGIFASLLDEQEIWTRASLRVVYLHPLYLGAAVQADLEVSFLENERRYWVASITPVIGAVVPTGQGVSDLSANVRILAGAQAGIALIFGGGR